MGRPSWPRGEGRVSAERAVVVASAGNFGQGVAYAARALDVPTVVFTSRNANRTKVARMRALGATVIEEGEDFDDARRAPSGTPRSTEPSCWSTATTRVSRPVPRRWPWS